MHDSDWTWWIAAVVGCVIGLAVALLIGGVMWQHAQGIVP